MKWKYYIKDKIYAVLLFSFLFIFLFLFLLAFKTDMIVIVIISIFFILLFLLLLLIDFYRKKFFYDTLLSYLEQLDKKYLVLEMLSKPNFYEGNLLYETLYETL